MADIDARIREAENRLTIVEGQILGHEKVCAERYKNLDNKLDDTKNLLKMLIPALIAFCAAVVLGKNTIDAVMSAVGG